MAKGSIYSIDEIIDEDVRKGIDRWDFSDIITHEDERIKIYFIGKRNILDKRKKEILRTQHSFLATPLTYRLEDNRVKEDLLYFEICPFLFHGFLFRNAKALEISNNSKKYVILSGDVMNSKEEIILPFQSKTNFPYKIFHKNTWNSIVNLYNELWFIYFGEKCLKEKTLSNEQKEIYYSRFENFRESSCFLFKILIDEFKEELESIEVLENKTVRKEHIKLLGKNKESPSLKEILKNYKKESFSSMKESFTEPETIKKYLENDSCKNYYGEFHEPVKKSIKNIGQRENIKSFFARTAINTGLACSTLILREKFPGYFTDMLAVLSLGHAGLDILAGYINATITYSKGDIITMPGWIGSIKELFDKDSYYFKKE